MTNVITAGMALLLAAMLSPTFASGSGEASQQSAAPALNYE